MKKWLRILAVLIVAVAALGIGGVAILVAVDTGKIRDMLSEQVQKATGRALVINGDLNLAISLRPSVIANDVTFANAEWGSSPSMVSLSRLEVGLDLVPLVGRPAGRAPGSARAAAPSGCSSGCGTMPRGSRGPCSRPSL